MKPSTFAFRKADGSPIQQAFMTLDSIGWQRIDSKSYQFDGRTRPDHGHIVFQYSLSGMGTLTLDNRTYEVPPGHAFLVRIPSHHVYRYLGAGSEPWEFLWLNVRGEDAIRYADRITSIKGGSVFPIDGNSEVLSRLWQLYETVEQGEEDPVELSAQVYKWMLRMLSDKPPAKSMAGGSKGLVERAKAYMNENYNHVVTLESLAEYVGVSRHHLCRLFTKQDDVSPIEYLRRRRTEAAAVLLRTTDRSVSDIAKAVGFEHPSYFSETFRAYYHKSPLAYRTMVLEFPYEHIRWVTDTN